MTMGCSKADDQIYVPPTCTQSGYTIYIKNGVSEFKDIIPATGHRFDEWAIQSEPDYDRIGIRTRGCHDCEYVESAFIYRESELDQIRLEGDLTGIGKTSQVCVDISFVGKNIQFLKVRFLHHP